MELFFRETGTGEPLIILHGLFGSGDNWLTQAKIFGEHYHVYVIDQRNHGRSAHAEDWNYSLMAADLLEFMNTQQIEKATIIGHSMGGKAVMEFAKKYPERINNLVVVDISPRYYAPHHQDVIAALKAVDLPTLASRNQAEERMMAVMPQRDVCQFLLKNLYREGDKYAWRMNLDVIEKNIENIGVAQTFESKVAVPTLFIRGERSNYIKTNDEELIKQHFTTVKIVTIAGAGHWIQAEKPQEFFDAVTDFIK